jgi:hypothetical protein
MNIKEYDNLISPERWPLPALALPGAAAAPGWHAGPDRAGIMQT